MEPVVIAFFGPQQVGKSTHADYIERNFIHKVTHEMYKKHWYHFARQSLNDNFRVSRYSFAKLLKERTQLMMPHINVYEVNKNEPRPELNGRSLREEWQWDGEHLRSERFGNIINDDPDLRMCTSNVQYHIQKNVDASFVVLNDDLRHIDEYEMITGFPHLFIRLDPKEEEVQHGSDHASEAFWREFSPDLIFGYDKTDDMLHNNCELIIERAIDIWLNQEAKT
jgi:hypothetical protein